jgi:hypothetical protein
MTKILVSHSALILLGNGHSIVAKNSTYEVLLSSNICMYVKQAAVGIPMSYPVQS